MAAILKLTILFEATVKLGLVIKINLIRDSEAF